MCGASLGLYVGKCWQPRQPTCLMGCVGASLVLYVGNLQVLWGVLEPVWGWQPTGLKGGVEPVWGCMLALATYMSYGVCWSQFGAACWQPTGPMGCVGASLRLYVGNLQASCCVFEPVWGCMLATYRSYGVCGASLGLYVGNLGNLHVLWGVLEPVWGWQPAGLMGSVGASLRLYVGNLQVLWGVFEPVWGWQPKGLMGCVEPVWGLMLAT